VAAPIRDDSIAHDRFRFILVAAFAPIAANDVMRDAGREGDFLQREHDRSFGARESTLFGARFSRISSC
jgi:hypothetical protein